MISFSTAATNTLRCGPGFGADLGRPDLAFLLGKTGGGAKTHRCLAKFFFLRGFPKQQVPDLLWFQEHTYRFVNQIDGQAPAAIRTVA